MNAKSNREFLKKQRVFQDGEGPGRVNDIVYDVSLTEKVKSTNFPPLSSL